MSFRSVCRRQQKACHVTPTSPAHTSASACKNLGEISEKFFYLQTLNTTLYILKFYSL